MIRDKSVPENKVSEESDKQHVSDTHSELSNDIFAELGAAAVSGGVSGAHHPESMSPTAAFLLAFPLVSTLTSGAHVQGAVTAPKDVDSRQDTPTLLQIGTMDSSGANNTDTLTNNFSSWLQTSGSGGGASKTYFPPAAPQHKNKHVEYVKRGPMIKQPGTARKHEFTYGTGHTQPQYKTQNDNCNTFNPFADVNHSTSHKGGAAAGAGASYMSAGWGATSYEYYQEQAPSCSKPALDMKQDPNNTAPPLYDQNHASVYHGGVGGVQGQEDKGKKGGTVNWMTEYTPAAFPPSLPPLDWGQQETGAAAQEERAWSWSPGRLLPQLGESQAVTSGGALPTLLGDLALGITAPAAGSHEDKRQGRGTRRQPPSCPAADMLGGSNFSVSQLVDKDGHKRGGAHRQSGQAQGRSPGSHAHGKRKAPTTSTSAPDCYKGAATVKWHDTSKRYVMCMLT